MELPHIGTHCSQPSCRQLDFLPFTCNLCKKEFCVDHHKYDAHNCTESYQADVQVPICPLCEQPVPSKRGQPPDLAVNDHMENNCKNKKKKIYTNKCSASGCKTKEMIPVSCDSCKQNFCLRHRHTVDHDCKGPPTARERALAAAASRLPNNKKQGSGSSGRSHSSGSGSSQSITRYFSPSSVGPRPTGHAQPVRTVNVSNLQGGLSEDEALARAMAASVQDQSAVQSSGGNRGQEDEDADAQLARAIAASMEHNSNAANSQRRNSNSCNVC
ncbi:AN1-type zinc finger protein 2A-like [Homarus americanus]|uniref:AN1-type zinc finger protein 2B-like n=1 Tax=Homarus americanus TaxID=6706 RepID=A0A8J5MNT6_HOMAM|nr:AN1-type zinc finger protein 2A-like [Homarus americanus]KAG7158346.1 AN1-type zinc finger protein 2B-like [Homarus americanus]